MKYIQIYDVDKNSRTMWQDYLKHKKQEPGYRIMMSSTPYNHISMWDGRMGWNAGLPMVELSDGTHVDIRDDDYLLHVHQTGENSGLVNKIKKASPETKVLASIDYGLKLWGRAVTGFNSVQHVVSNIEKADFIFSTEPEIAWLLEEELGRKVPMIPHPVNVDEMVKYRGDYEVPKTCICMTHVFDMDYYLPHLVLRDLPIRTHLIGIDHRAMGEMFARANGVLYNRVSEYTSFEYMLNTNLKTNNPSVAEPGFFSKAYMVYDAYGLKVSGRVQTDCSSLSIPCIGSDLQYFQKTLFPETTTGLYEIKKQREIARRLIEDVEFYNSVSNNAFTRVRNFDFKKTKERIGALVEGKEVDEVNLINGYPKEVDVE